ncbi:hypothetical protein M3182_23945 [Mesobacillus maritimus]|uniref:hypothetical protein n=1 Tax=Mesobacillus maritimus TaxID=1643336 RepID=UPI00203CF6C5|nr:hypothetical protein [Mesobacillus maritimus]MCM3588717.1 hypothetical protein [Mesobacillus maritimus]MCM3671953.1 hypothetical protein [Mesobacillus maritimus]
MKKNSNNQELLYFHLNDRDHFVLSSGIEFYEFSRSLSDSLQKLLLLKHKFEEGEFNNHTLLHYVHEESLQKLMEENIANYGDFCWIDFEELEGVNVLSPQELAEILYLGHTKHHLKLPFYNQLGNRFAYLSQDDGWLNKIYYRNLNDFFRMLGQVIPRKIMMQKTEKTLLGMRKKREYPPINKEILKALTPVFKEGVVFALRKVEHSRNRLDLPLWVIGDYDDMDDMFDGFSQASNNPPDGRLIFDKKLKEWSLQAE